MKWLITGCQRQSLSNDRTIRLSRFSGLFAALLLTLAGAAQSQTLQTYVIKDLGSLGGESRAMGVNNLGHTVGWYIDGGGRTRPFRHDPNPGMVDLGTFNGATGSGIAYGINNNGVVVGYATNAAGQKRAFKTGAFASLNPLTDDLGTLGGLAAEARGISDTGFVAGSAQQGNGRWRAFRHAPGEMLNLGILDNGNGSSYGLSVNNYGQVAGHSDKNTQHGKAFRFEGTLPLLELGLTVRDSEGAQINLNGDIIGTEEQGSLINGFLYRDGFPLANLGANVVANGINDSGVYVGSYPVGADTHAFVNRSTVREDLMDLITGPSATSFTGVGKSMAAMAIAQSGIIVGWGDGPSGRRAIKLVPYPVTPRTVSPSLVPAGGASFTLTVDGWGYSRACQLHWNGTPLTTTFVSVLRLTATVPASLITSPTIGTVTVKIPNAPGESNALSVTVGAYGVTATPNAVQFGSPINVTWAAPPGSTSTDWVGLYLVGADNTSWIAYAYTNGSATGGTTFYAPANAGQYEVRYLVNNSYESRASSAPITVSALSGYSVTTTATTVSAGQQVSVNWTAPSGRPAVDWIGLFAVGADNRTYIAWVHTGGATSGNTTFVAPAQAGSYQFRYLLNNGYEDTARSSNFTVN